MLQEPHEVSAHMHRRLCKHSAGQYPSSIYVRVGQAIRHERQRMLMICAERRMKRKTQGTKIHRTEICRM